MGVLPNALGSRAIDAWCLSIARMGPIGAVQSTALQTRVVYPQTAWTYPYNSASVDIFSLQKLIGHADLQVRRRYLAQITAVIVAAQRIESPTDKYGQ